MLGLEGLMYHPEDGVWGVAIRSEGVYGEAGQVQLLTLDGGIDTWYPDSELRSYNQLNSLQKDEALEKLPVGTILVDGAGDPWVKDPDGWGLFRKNTNHPASISAWKFNPIAIYPYFVKRPKREILD